MNRQSMTFIVAILFLMIPTAFGQRQADLGQSRDAVANGWQFDYQAAREKARSANKPMMVVLRCVP
jgi:hypothetical protein